MQVDLHFMFVTKLHMGSGILICTKYTHSFLYSCLFVLVLFLVMIVLVFYLVVLILCTSQTRDEGCKLALCYILYVHGIGCLCVTMPSVLSLLNKQTNKINTKLGVVRKPVSVWCDYHLPHTVQHISFA